MQPKITTAQIDLGKPDNAFEKRYQVVAYTKTNAFREVFVNGISIEIYSANSTTDVFVVSGDFSETFLSGTAFHVSGSTSNDGDYTTIMDATFAAGFTTIYVTTVPTTEGAGLGTGFVDTGVRLVQPDSSTTQINMFLVGRDTTTIAKGAGFITRSAFTRDVGAASILRIGGVVDTFSRESLDGTPDDDLTADTTFGSIKLSIKGGSTNLIAWQGIVILQTLEV